MAPIMGAVIFLGIAGLFLGWLCIAVVRSGAPSGLERFEDKHRS